MDTSRRPRAAVAWACALAGLVLIVYGRTAAFGYVDFDDPVYVSDNPQVRAGLTLDGARWALTSGVTGNWHPLTWISLMADESLGGGAATHHGINVLLHLVNTLLVFGLLASSTGRLEPSGWVAALFAVHPLHVESVAWISERKDVLCALFGLIAIAAYGRAAVAGRALPYVLSCVAFAASLAAKPMLVTLPILLLALDRWPLARPRSLLDKGAYAVLALGASALALTSQRGGGAIASAEALAWSRRAANVPVACLAYLRDVVWPAGLSPLYGILPGGHPAWSVAAALLALAGLVGIAWALRRERPWIAAGGAWFLVSLIPVIGIVQIGVQSRADRYMYLPILGPLVAVVFTLDPGRENARRRTLTRAIVAVAVGALAAVAWRQTGFWRDGVALFARAVVVEPWNADAQHGLGIALHTRGETVAALAPLARAVELNPTRPGFRRDYGGTLLEAGRHDDGVAQLRAALELAPGDTRTRVDLARLRVSEGDLAGALAGFDEALRLAPSDPYALKWEGATLLLAGRLEEGRATLESAARADPDDAQTRAWLTRTQSGAAPDDPVRRAW